MKSLAEALFSVPACRTSVTQGSVLLSSPFMIDEDFNHSVGVIIDYLPEDGATGVVLNNISECRLDEVIEGVRKDIKIKVFNGGPLGRDRLLFIHTLGPDIIEGAREFAPGVYIGGDFDSILTYINAGYEVEGSIRFFIGYCCWGPGQLEKEISQGSWAVGSSVLSASNALKDAGDRYWHRAVKSLGSIYRSWSVLPRHAEFN